MGDADERTAPAFSARAGGVPRANTAAPSRREAASADGSDRDARLSAAVALIERDFRRRGLGLTEVPKAAHFSPFHFHRTFRRRYGKSPKRLIDELRIAEVQRLLLKGVSARDAAEAVGFAHQSHMTTRFKRVLGITPARWLRQAGREGRNR